MRGHSRHIKWSFCSLLSISIACAESATIGGSQTGYVTFYGALSPSQDPASAGGGLYSGACGYGVLNPNEWPFSRVAALGPNNTLSTAVGTNKLGCGQCIQATCNGSNCARNASASGVELLVTDTCPSCDPNQLNIPAATFLQSFGSSLSLGRVNISFQQVECSPPGSIVVSVKQFNAGDGGYIALSFLSVAESGNFAGVDIKTSGSRTWAPMVNSYGSVWSASNFGEPPLDLRLTSEAGQVLVAMGVITNATNSTFRTTVQFGNAPAPAPVPARTPRTSLLPSAPSPSNSIPQLTIGVRLNTPLYFAPLDSSTLAAYPGLVFTFTDCYPGAPTLNITINRMLVPSEDGTSTSAWAIHTLNYVPVQADGNTPLFKLLDYSFLNLETGVFAQLYEEQYLSFSNRSFDGSIPAESQGQNNRDVVFPTYVSLASMTGPADFDYAIQLPPAANEMATASYLTALANTYYYLTVIALGTTGQSASSPPCALGIGNLGPWADYLRSIISQLAPASQINGELYNNIPLGTDYTFQGSSFTIRNAMLQGNILTSRKELSAQDCGTSCSPVPQSGPICRGWNYCGAISGCITQPYQDCQLLNSTAAKSLTTANGFLNIVKNSSTRSTAGALFLPPPTGLNLVTFSGNNSNFGSGAPVPSP